MQARGKYALGLFEGDNICYNSCRLRVLFFRFGDRGDIVTLGHRVLHKIQPQSHYNCTLGLIVSYRS